MARDAVVLPIRRGGRLPNARRPARSAAMSVLSALAGHGLLNGSCKKAFGDSASAVGASATKPPAPG